MCLTSGVGFGAVAGRITSGRGRDNVKLRRRGGLKRRDTLQLMQMYDAFLNAIEAMVRVWLECLWIVLRHGRIGILPLPERVYFEVTVTTTLFSKAYNSIVST